jgi:hypothetical protein
MDRGLATHGFCTFAVDNSVGNLCRSSLSALPERGFVAKLKNASKKYQSKINVIYKYTLAS